MSLYKRDNMWWIDFTTASGERIRRSADTSNKLEAQELHDRLKAESWRVDWESGGNTHGMRRQRSGSRKRPTSARTMTTCSSCAGWSSI
jgi:hypothetical protein